LLHKITEIINRRYSTTIKTLSKLFTTKIKALGEIQDKEQIKAETAKVMTKLYSIIDRKRSNP
jgi:ribosomal protein S20